MAMTDEQRSVCDAYRIASNRLDNAPTATEVKALGAAESAARDALLLKLKGSGAYIAEWNAYVDAIKAHDRAVRSLERKSSDVADAAKLVRESANDQAVKEMAP